MSEQQVAQHMGVTIHVERPHEKIPGLTVGELGGPIYELVKLISSTLIETGQILEASRYSDLGSFVLESLKEGAKADPSASLGIVLERVGRDFFTPRNHRITNTFELAGQSYSSFPRHGSC